MNTGTILGGRPCLGSWSLYGLGSASENLPGYVVLLDNPEEPPGGNRNWSTGFMPPTFQGTKLRDGNAPVLHLRPEGPISNDRQRAKLDFIQELNRRHHEQRSDDSDLEARIASYELAYRMQSAARKLSISRRKPRRRESFTASARKRPNATAATVS